MWWSRKSQHAVRAWQIECEQDEYMQCIRHRQRRTGDILLQDIKLLEHRAQKALRVLIHDKDLPSAWGVYGADRLQKL